MTDNPALQAAETPPASNPSEPVAEVKTKTEEGDIQAAPKEGEAAEPAKGDEPKPELTEAEKVKQAMQKRIDRQTAASKALQERVRQLEQEVAQAASKAPKADDAPKQDDFASYDEWEKATIEFHAKRKADEILKAEKEKELKAAQERQAQETRRQFEEKENTFRTRTPDYDRVAGEAVETLTALGLQGANIAGLRDMVMQFDNPPELIYQLGKDTSIIETLVTMEPIKAMRELVKLELALESSVKAEPQKAPEPIKPVGGKGGVKPLAERSGKELLEWVKK